MSQPAYPFDPHGTNPENKVTETYTISASMGRYRCAMIKHAPFYYDSLVVKDKNGVVLEEGVDYYVGHTYIRGCLQTALPLYGSIWSVPEKHNGYITVEYQTLGGDYLVSTDDMNDYINNRFFDPSVHTWEDVMGSDRWFPPVNIQFDRDAWHGEEDYMSAISAIKTTLDGIDPRDGDIFDLLMTRLLRIEDVLNDSDFANHIANKNNPHNTTAHLIGALGEDMIAKNALKAYGMTLQELAQYVNSRDITQDDLDNYFALQGERRLSGDLVFKDGLGFLSWENGQFPTLIDFGQGMYRSQGAVNQYLNADTNLSSGSQGAELNVGKNVLRVASSPNAQQKNKATWNGQPLIDTGNMEDHDDTVSGQPIKVQHEDTDTVSWTGEGDKDSSPLEATLLLPDASDTERGIAQLSSSITEGDPKKAATPLAEKRLLDEANTKVPSTTTINGLNLATDINLIKDHFGLDQVDNTSDKNKPVSDPMRDAAKGFAPIAHTHSADEISLPPASTTVKGVARARNHLIDEEKTSGVAPVVASRFLDRLRSAAIDADNLMPDDAIDVTQYGGLSYLPVPAVGSYDAAGPNWATYSFGAMLESDNSLVVLRNGSDILTSGVFFSYMERRADESWTDYIPTTSRYQPAFLQAGEEITVVYGNDDYMMLAQMRDLSGNLHTILIPINGTLDPATHTRYCRVTGFGVGTHSRIAVWGGRTWTVRIIDLGGGGISFEIYSIDNNLIGVGNTLEWEIETFSYIDFWDNQSIDQTHMQFVETGYQEGGGIDNARSIIYAEQKVFNTTPRHSGYGSALVRDGDVLKFLLACQTYSNNSQTSGSCQWNISFHIDLSLKSVRPDAGLEFPIEIKSNNGAVQYEGSIISGNNEVGLARSSGNRSATQVFTKGMGVNFSGDSNYLPVLVIEKIANDIEPDAIADRYNCTMRQVGEDKAVTLMGTYGSPVMYGQRSYQYLPGTWQVFRQSSGGIVMEKGDPNGNYHPSYDGYGPTQTRNTLGSTDFRKYKGLIFKAKQGGDPADEAIIGTVLSHSTNWGAMGFDASTGAHTGDISVTTATLDAVRDKVLEVHTDYTDQFDEYVDANVSLYIFHGLDVDWHLGFINVRDKQAAGNTRYRLAMFQFKVANTSGGDIGAVTDIEPFGGLGNGSSSATNWSTDSHEGGQGSGIVELDDGSILFNMVTNRCGGYVGHSAHYGAFGMVSLSNKKWVHSDMRFTSYHNTSASGSVITGRFGFMSMKGYANRSAMGGPTNARGWPADTWARITGNTQDSPEILVTSVQVESGWQIYFTEELRYYNDRQTWLVPETTIDVRDEFPSSYRNNTFYIYVTSEDEDPRYVLRQDKVPDDSFATYIGYAKTDSNRIIELDVQRVTRLGSFREMEEHINDPNAHGFGNITADTIGLGLVENKRLKHELFIPTFEEVFDTWYRFSHVYNSTSQPANEGELNQWSYQPGADTIVCTINSATYIGFVSNEGVGNYEFETELSSNNGDNDSLAVVAAFVVDPDTGQECTISVVRSGSTEAHLRVSNQYEISYNHHQPDRIQLHTAAIGDSVGGWTGKKCKVKVVKDQTGFTISTTKITSGAQGDYGNEVRINYADRPELDKFKGAVRYGYACMSQPNSTFANILRPDEDGRNFYASAEMIQRLNRSRHGFHVISGSVPTRGVVPLPAEAESYDECGILLSPGYLADTYGGTSGFETIFNPATGEAYTKIMDFSGATHREFGCIYSLVYSPKL